MAFERNFTHRSRRVPWGGGTGAGEIIRLGVDWSAAAFVWTFAETQGGTPVINLSNATLPAQGVSATYDATIVHPRTGKIVGGTRIIPNITEATLEGLAGWGAAAKTLFYDLLITPSGQPQQVLCFGTLTVHPGIGD